MITVKAVRRGFCPSGCLRNEGDKFQWPEGHVLPRWVEIVTTPHNEPAGAPAGGPVAAPVAEPVAPPVAETNRRGRKPKGSVDDLV